MQLIGAAMLVIALALVPPIVGTGAYLVLQLTPILLYCVFAVSANLAWGYTGIFTLGHALFFGIGAYAVGLLATKKNVTSLAPLLLAAGLVGLLAGLLVGVFLFAGRRVGQIYVALATLALAYAAERLANGWDRLGAANGIPSLPLPRLHGSEIAPGASFYYLSLALLAAVILLFLWLIRSQLGLVLQAIRDDEERAEFFGYRRTVLQIAVLGVTGAMASAAGGLYGLEEGFVSPSFLGVVLSTQVLLFVVLGGRGTVFGPLLGVFVIQLAGQRLRDGYPQLWPVLLGMLLLLTIVYLPGGLTDGLLRLRQLLLRRFDSHTASLAGPGPKTNEGTNGAAIGGRQ
jgi:branched-chain amino acid transport system permease protein